MPATLARYSDVVALDSDLAEAVEATLRDADSAKWRAQRARAIHRLYHDDGVSMRRIADLLRDELLSRGVPEGDLVGMGVTFENVRRILRRPSP